MSRALYFWKFKLCLGAAAAILASAMAPQRPAHEQQAKGRDAKLQMAAGTHNSGSSKNAAPAPARQPAAADSRDRLAAML